MAKIPETRLEVFHRLDRHLTREERADLAACSDNELSDYHFGLGMWIRNTWIYAGGGRTLSALFDEEHEDIPADVNTHPIFWFGSPDMLSEKIIRAYRDYLIEKNRKGNIET